MISPPISLVDCLQQVELQFDNHFSWGSSGDEREVVDVDVSTDLGSTWINVLRLENHSTGTPIPTTRVVDLTPQVEPESDSLKVRFHYYHGADDGRWAIDNVKVSCKCTSLGTSGP